jgi:hypothetical protein
VHFQLSFARAGLELLSDYEDAAFEATRNGIVMLGETELSLDPPIETLRKAYGDQLRVSAPLVRYRTTQGVEQPIMGLRVVCDPRHLDIVQRDLLMRSATVLEARVQDKEGVLSANGPLPNLLGLRAQIQRLTDNKGQLAMWLSHYEKVDVEPPGGDAA